MKITTTLERAKAMIKYLNKEWISYDAGGQLVKEFLDDLTTSVSKAEKFEEEKTMKH